LLVCSIYGVEHGSLCLEFACYMGKGLHNHQEFLKQLGEKIASIRATKGLSQEALAHAAGLHRAYVGKVERGEVNVTTGTLNKLADALEIKLEIEFLEKPLK
jgi:ribosome-binding protein aMBF1 (putative translation factor)